MNELVIGIAAKAKSGKDTLAEYFIEDHGFERISFADPVKAVSTAAFGVPEGMPEDLFYTNDPYLKEEWVHPITNMTVRQMNQFVGTDLFRENYSENVWIDRLKLTASKTKRVIIADIRFENEAQAVRDMGGTVVHLTRPGVESVASHVSEAGVKKKPGDLSVVNNSTIESLYDKGKDIFSLVLKQQQSVEDSYCIN